MNSDQTNEFSKGKRPKLLQASDPAVLLQIFGDRKTPHLANPPVWKLEHNRRKAEKLEKLLSLKPVSKNAIKAASPNTQLRSNAVGLVTMRLLRKIGDYPLRVYDWFILWLSAAVHRWLDAKTIAEAVEPPPSRAQQALDALNTRIEQSMQASRILGLIGNLANRWENLSSAAKICCGAVVAFATGATRLWWCGEPLKLNFTALLHTLVSGLGFLFVAMVAANLLIAALFVILLALSLPLHLWRLAEMISGFLMRHVLPQGVVWRYTWWRLRRTGRRRLCSALVDSEKVTPLTITLSDGTFQYAAEVIKENGRYFYRVEDITVEITKYDYGQVIVNPRLYYFSTALKLHFVVERIKKAARDYTTCKDFQNNPKK